MTRIVRTVVAGQHDVTVVPSQVAGQLRYRWTCSCGCEPGEWKPRRFAAVIGGKTHERRAGR